MSEYTQTDPPGAAPNQRLSLVPSCVCYQGALSYYAVYDGHGGVEAAKYASVQLHSVLGRRLQHQQPKDALHDAFLDTDRMFVDRAKREVTIAVTNWA